MYVQSLPSSPAGLVMSVKIICYKMAKAVVCLVIKFAVGALIKIPNRAQNSSKMHGVFLPEIFVARKQLIIAFGKHSVLHV